MISKEIDIRSAKSMGGIGAILEIVGSWVPYLGYVLPLAGLILVLLSLKRISEATGKPTIFKDYLTSFIFMTIGNFLLVFVSGVTILSSFEKGFKIFHMGASLFALLLAWVVVLIGAYFLRLSFNTVAEATGVGMFETSATLIFYGAISAIIFVGVLVFFVGKIIEVVAFYSLPDRLEVLTTS